MTWEHKVLAQTRSMALRAHFYRSDAPVSSAVMVFCGFFGLGVVVDLVLHNVVFSASAWSWTIQKPLLAFIPAFSGLAYWNRERAALNEYLADKKTYDVAAATHERDQRLEKAR
jgi:phosphate/sulfate permease